MLSAVRKRRVVTIGAGVLAAAAVGAVAVGFGERAGTPAGPSPSASADPSASTGQSPGFVEVRQSQAGFALAYPSDWTRVDSGDPSVPLLAARGPYSFQVRVRELPAAVGPRELPAAKQLTDQIVSSNQSAKLLAQPQQINLGGLPGYFYLYSFTDPATGQPGAHSHFFLFRGKTMIALVFQAVPAEEFKAGASIFDRITATFRVL